MARPRPPNSRTYGIPLYFASWVPFLQILQHNSEKDGAENAGGSETSPPPATGFLVLGGGGGDSRSGIPNALVVAEFDFAAASLSESPVDRHETGAELPYRMAVHPSGEGLVCAFLNTCKWFEWDVSESDGAGRLAIKPSEKLLTPLQDAGLQLALAFNLDGSLLAAGGENGHLRVLKWPTMEFILDLTDAHDTVKDLDFSSDGKLLVSLGSSGACRVWDLESSTVVANLTRENGERFGFCRFSRGNSNQILFVTVMEGDRGGIVTWDTASWKRIRSKPVVHDSISAFSLSGDGKFLAIGTVEGNVVIVNSATMQVNKLVKKAHLGLVTTLTFSHDSRALLSTSFDSSAMVTSIQHKKQSGISTWICLFIIVVAILFYIIMDSEALLYLCPHIKKGEDVGASQLGN